jgi:hypothetical protein
MFSPFSGHYLSHPFHDQPYLAIVVVTASLGPRSACGGNPDTRRLVRQVTPNLFRAFVKVREKHRLFILHESLQVAR